MIVLTLKFIFYWTPVVMSSKYRSIIMWLETAVIKSKDGWMGSELNVAREEEGSAPFQSHSDDFKRRR